MSALPALINLFHVVSISFSLSNTTKSEIDGLSLKYGPALIAIKSRPASVKDTVSASPDGVSWSVAIFSILEFGKREV